MLAQFFLAAGAIAADQPGPPDRGFVPDAATAIKIAIAVWEPIYGAKNIAAQKPYRARLEGDRWIVEGSAGSTGEVGGTAIAEIARADGRVLRVSHGR